MEHNIVMRLATFLLVFSVCILYANSDDTNKLRDVIYAETDSIKETKESLKCEDVEGRVSECSECYACDSAAVAKHRANNHIITYLTLNDINCGANETICCVSQKDFLFREKEPADSACGCARPEGDPRALRPAIRAVLQGEYPWRAWIYDVLEPGKPLCAAVYVNKEGCTLLTTGSCVDGRRPHELVVLFNRDPNDYRPLDVKRIDVHEGYDKSTNVNDVAVLSVASVPGWAEHACLPVQPAPHGSACVAVADNTYSLNHAILLQSKCSEDGALPHPSLMCTAPRRGDFSPERGGGVFCADEQSPKLVYSVYGLYLHNAREGLVAINVNVTHFTHWINNKALEYKNSINN